MLTSVAGDPAAIGYVSMGSLNETVKAVSVDGVAATVGRHQGRLPTPCPVPSS